MGLGFGVGLPFSTCAIPMEGRTDGPADGKHFQSSEPATKNDGFYDEYRMIQLMGFVNKSQMFFEFSSS